MEDTPLHMGIDYGSKLAGSTAAAMLQGGKLHVWESTRGQDADRWLMKLVAALKPKAIYIDAPLTLPAVYAQKPYLPTSDFFYRACDREVQAMSPMFIGGLTARAIRLRTQLAATGTTVLETYPSQLVRLLFPNLQNYKKGLEAMPALATALQKHIKYEMHEQPHDWHQLDAMLAWYSGLRHAQNQSILYGNAKEGRIIV